MLAKLILPAQECCAKTDKWHDMRHKGIGGSDIAAVVGLSKFKSPFEVWAEKTGHSKPEDLSDNEYVYWGTVLEEAVANRFSELTGKKVRRCGMLQRPDKPFMLADVDRLIVGEEAGLECKTTNAYAKDEWEGDKLPDMYYLQCQWYMAVTGFPVWYIACLIGGNNFVWKKIDRNDADIASMEAAAENFWELVKTDTMPPVDATEGCGDVLAEKFKAEHGEETNLPAAARASLDKLAELNRFEKELKDQKTLVENELKAMMGTAEHGYIDDWTVHWTECAGRTTVNAKKLAKDKPEIYAKYTNVGKPTRRFSVKRKEAEGEK